MNRRYERASTVLTSNKGFEEWGEIFGDEVMAAALIDWLLHHSLLVNIQGNSFRMRKHSELWQALHPDTKEESPTDRGSSPPRSGTFSSAIDITLIGWRVVRGIDSAPAGLE